MHHRLPLIAALVLWSAPALAEFPLLGFSTPATQIGRRAEAPADYAFPIAAYGGTAQPSRLATGALDQRAYRLDGWQGSTLALIQPLQDQMERAGFRVIFACATTACGGFDFRYAMEVLPEPQMHVDLGDFRYLVAVRGPDEIASLLVSTAPGQGFVQLTSIAPGALITDTDPAAPTRPATLPQTNPTPEPNPTAQPTNLAAAIALSGTAPLDDLVFASGSATLASGDYASLVALAAWLKANPDLRVMLVGHTDAEGALDSNIALSRQRATSVRARLIDSLGVEADQIDAAGAGYLAPRASNQTPEGRQKNRRVEVMLTSTPVN